MSTSATPEGRGGRRRAPDWLSSSLAEDRDAPGRGERSKSQEELPVCAPPSACLEREGEASARSSSDESVEERQRLPRRRKELTEEGDLPLERSKHVYRSHPRRPTATPARTGHALTLLVTRHARTSSGSSRQNASPSRRHSRHKKWPPRQQSKTGTRYPPTLLQKRSHPPRHQVLPGKRSQTSS